RPAMLSAAVLLALAALLLVLLRCLVHRIQYAEIVFGVLKVAFRHDTVAAAGRIPAKLQIFLEELLRRPADPHIGTVAVEDVISIERRSATARAVVAATHALHVHTGVVVLSRCGQTGGVLGRLACAPRGNAPRSTSFHRL